MLFDEGFKFTLISELKEISETGWIFIAAAAVIAVVLVIYLVQRRKQGVTTVSNTSVGSSLSTPDMRVKAATANTSVGSRPSATLVLVHGALCIAMSFILSYIKLFSMPTGGSITLASMLPLMIYANRYGVKAGITAGVVYGFLQYVQNPWMFHWLQLIIDYPLAFGLIGLGGLLRGEDKLVGSILIGGLGRLVCHLLSGIIFFGKYIMLGEGAETAVGFLPMLKANIAVSAAYNAPYMLADIAICAVIALIPAFRKALKNMK